jgi:hypothetical protein
MRKGTPLDTNRPNFSLFMGQIYFQLYIAMTAGCHEPRPHGIRAMFSTAPPRESLLATEYGEFRHSVMSFGMYRTASTTVSVAPPDP